MHHDINTFEKWKSNLKTNAKNVYMHMLAVSRSKKKNAMIPIIKAREIVTVSMAHLFSVNATPFTTSEKAAVIIPMMYNLRFYDGWSKLKKNVKKKHKFIKDVMWNKKISKEAHLAS